MQRREYCEIEVVYKGSGAETNMYVLRSDGRHALSNGRCGEMMAQLGEQGWELVAATVCICYQTTDKHPRHRAIWLGRCTSELRSALTAR